MSDSLIECITKQGATFVKKDSLGVSFICKCGTPYIKTQILICKTSGPFCKDCTQINTYVKKLKKRIEINNALLAAREASK